MRFSTRFIVIAPVLLASVLAWGQQPQINGRTSVLVRMSFTRAFDNEG